MTETLLPKDAVDATLVGRLWRADVRGPAVIAVRHGMVVDITSPQCPTMHHLLEMSDPSAYVASAKGISLGALAEVQGNLLAPCDLQAIKACGVTFSKSMVERVIEERTAGDPTAAEAVRTRIGATIGESLAGIVPGSDAAKRAKSALEAEGMWSQYLEVGIGPDAEVFTKAQPMSAVGWGADIGLHPISAWNNPEPEIVLAVNSRGGVRGATLGNDVNLRDVEGRSALLLGKAKDNNASTAIGPFIRLFDSGYGLDDAHSAELTLTVDGPEGFRLEGHSSMTEISRAPLDLVRQTCGQHHQYPDGFMLFLGTLFAPTEDRDIPGEGFTHKVGDMVTISEPRLGTLMNHVRLSTDCAPWTFGTGALMANLAKRGLL